MKIKKKIILAKYILVEYGIKWVFYRLLYLIKLKLMFLIPGFDDLFERKPNIKRIDIFTLDVEEIERFLKALPLESQNKIIIDADNAIMGKLKGFSSIELDYGKPINWHLQPITQQVIDKNLKWYRIPDFNSERGDIKVVWEASRFTHFYLFTRAFLLTGDKKYYKVFSEQLMSWLDNNIYSFGANFKCGQECSLRMINALMAFSLFSTRGLTSDIDKENIRELSKRCYKKVRSNFFYAKHMRNNHTFSEICGWITGAWCSDDSRAIKKGYKLLEKEIRNQFYPDGGYIQYSLNYQRFTLQILECILKIEEKTKIQLSEEAIKRVKNSVLQLYQMQDDITGDVPNYGSNDGALIFPVTVCGYRNFTPLINTLYSSITGDRLYKKGEYDEELLWFGKKRIESQIREIEKVSTAYKNSGFYTIRRIEGFLMVFCHTFDFRPFHMDGMHIDIWHKGENIFCDSGTYSYASDLGKELVRTAAHNTVKIDSVEQMNSHSNFLIYKWIRSKDVKHDNNSFFGTMISKNGYQHVRKVVKTNQGYDLVDNIYGSNESCSLLFHTPCEVRINSYGFDLFKDGKKLCEVKTSSKNIEVQKAYKSLYYLRKDDINCIVVRYKMFNHSCNMMTSIVLL